MKSSKSVVEKLLVGIKRKREESVEKRWPNIKRQKKYNDDEEEDDDERRTEHEDIDIDEIDPFPMD